MSEIHGNYESIKLIKQILSLIIHDLFLDVDECSLNTDRCSHNCQDTHGSYVCSCPAGYMLGTDGRTCTGKANHGDKENVVHYYSPGPSLCPSPLSPISYL